MLQLLKERFVFLNPLIEIFTPLSASIDWKNKYSGLHYRIAITGRFKNNNIKKNIKQEKCPCNKDVLNCEKTYIL